MCAAPVEDTTGLPRGVSCVQHQSKIPRACPVESHVCSTSRRYHGLAPWSLMCAAPVEDTTLAPWSLMCAAPVEDTTGLPRGVSCVQLPEFQDQRCSDATGSPRGASRFLLFSNEREAPRDKPVASRQVG